MQYVCTYSEREQTGECANSQTEIQLNAKTPGRDGACSVWHKNIEHKLHELQKFGYWGCYEANIKATRVYFISYLCLMLYYRRKILLALLEVFDGQLTTTSLQKYLFLFTRTQTPMSFDFVPYRYGCYSFQANQDIMTMEKYGYLESVEQPNGGHCIKLKLQGNYLSELDMFERQALLNVKKDFGNLTQQDLIRYTYQKYPFYAINSTIAHELLTREELKAVDAQKRTYTEPQLFSIGYEGLTLEAYMKKLILQDVHVLCDVRKNAYSQKYGFSKSQLQKACEGVNILYVHVPELGIESDMRQDLRSQTDYDILFSRYEKTTLEANREALLRVKSLIDSKKRVALTCFERNPAQCHRTRVARALMSLPDINYTFKDLQ